MPHHGDDRARRRGILLSLTIAIALLVSPARAANPLDALDAHRRTLASMTFDAVIQTPKAEGRWSRIELQFAYLAPNLYRSHLKMGVEGDLITVSDGSILWSYHSRRKEAHRQDYEEARKRLLGRGPSDPITALAMTEIPLSKLYALTDSRSANGAIRLTLVPRRPVPHYDLLELTLAADGRTPREAVSFKSGKVVAKITFRNVRTNPPLDNSLFVFAPPKGTEIIRL